jgi:hypothetical protein
MYAISSRANGNGGSLNSALKHPAQAVVIAKQKHLLLEVREAFSKKPSLAGPLGRATACWLLLSRRLLSSGLHESQMALDNREVPIAGTPVAAAEVPGHQQAGHKLLGCQEIPSGHRPLLRVRAGRMCRLLPQLSA